jgi:serine/threonine protein kinase
MTLPRSLTQLGRYRIVREIGRGSMGRVYLANDPNIDRQIALKVLAPVGGLGQREELHRRFLAETRAAGKLNHTHIVTVYDAEVDAETSLPYIAMEWVEGRSLEEELRLRGPLPAAQAVLQPTPAAAQTHLDPPATGGHGYRHLHVLAHRRLRATLSLPARNLRLRWDE